MQNEQKSMTAGELAALPEHPSRNMLWKEPQYLNGTPIPAKATEDDAAFEMSIAQTGVQIPVIITESGLLVDGVRRVKAAAKFDDEKMLPVHVCADSSATLVIVNSIVQQKSLTKFQRLFTLYPMIKDAVEALVKASAARRMRNLKDGKSPTVQLLDSRENGTMEYVGESAEFMGVKLLRMDNLAQLLNVSRSLLMYCRGVYTAIDEKSKKRPRDEVAYMANRFVFAENIPAERLAAAIGGYDSERDPEEEAKNQTFKVVSSKAENAIKTLLERVTKDVYLSEEHLPEVEKQFEMFALKLPPVLADILAKKLRTARQNLSAK